MKMSLQPLKLLLASVVIGPFLGLCYSYFSNRTLIGLQADEELVLHFGAYMVIFLIFVSQLQSALWVNLSILNNVNLKRIVKRLLIAVAGITIVIFIVAGSKILTGESNRGAIRVELGLLGPIYAYVLKYALPTIAFMVAIFLSLAERVKSTEVASYKARLYVAITLVVLCAFMSGAKFTIVLVCMPLVCSFWALTSLRGKLAIAFAAFAFMVGSHLFFQSTDQSLLSSMNYVYARATRIAAYGVLGCWEFVSSRDFESLPAMANGVLGRRVGEFVLSSLDATSSRIFSDPIRLITVLYYPSYDRAVSGTTGLTLTLFGELVLHLRLFWFLGFALFLGWFALVLRAVSTALRKGDLVLGIVGFTYILMVLLPVMNSGLVFKIISLPFAIHMIGVALLVKVILGREYSNRRARR